MTKLGIVICIISTDIFFYSIKKIQIYELILSNAVQLKNEKLIFFRKKSSNLGVMDWSVCIICGTQIGELLKCPIDSLQKDSGLEVHATILQNVGKFEELDALAVKVYLSREITPELLLKC